MQKMSPIPSVALALHIRSARIPVHWTVRVSHEPEMRDFDGRVIAEAKTERVFWPQVETTNWGDVVLAEVEDALDLRNELFKMFNTNRTEEAALRFLNRVGAWRVEEGGDPKTWTWAQGTFANVTFGHRLAIGIRVVPSTLSEMLQYTEHWYRQVGILRNPTKLKAEYREAPPADGRATDQHRFASEAYFMNTLPVSLEWHGKDPYAVIETISAWELMVAVAWSDVVSRAEEQVCARCGTRFTWPRKKKYCQWECGHLVAVRKHKKKKALEKQTEKEAAKAKTR